MSGRRTEIDWEILDGVAHVTLNGPPKNEMGIDFFEALSDFARAHLSVMKVSGMVLRGAGRHFSSGADVLEIEALAASDGGRVARLLEDNIRTFLAFEHASFPVIAVIRGACLGAGMELALACSHRVAEKNAVFSLPETTFGIIPGCGGTVRLPRLIPKGEAVELILTGRTVLADEALRLGIVDRLVDRQRGVEAALEIIHGGARGGRK